jgi:hypothetical protein
MIPNAAPIGVEQHCPLTLSIVAFGVHQYVPAEIERTLRADCHVGDLDMRHPLERKVGILRATRAHADDGCASVVHQILSPERILTRVEYTRVEVQLSLVLGDGDVRAEYGADARDKGFAHGYVLAHNAGTRGRRHAATEYRSRALIRFLR